MLLAVLYGLSCLFLAVAAVFAYLFYRDFFATSSFPVEWDLLLAGLLLLAGSMALRSVSRVVAANIVPELRLVALFAGGVLLAVSGYILWDKFRL